MSMRIQPRLLGYGLLVLFLSSSGCAEIDSGLRSTADTLAPQDIVTGKRVLNPESEQAETARTTKQEAEILASARSKGYAVDTDEDQILRLHRVLNRLVEVSHRPSLPWDIHLIESPDVNAFTIGGGKIFVYRGLFGGLVEQANDDEIAAVVAHEMGHVAARHIGKSEGLQLASALSSGARKSTGGGLYQASFTTLQEDEADRIGLLYMALAGYDPRVVPAIWQRADQKFGSNPQAFHYAYDHSLNADRAKKTAALVPLAMKYFEGEGTHNSNYGNALAANDLIPRTVSGKESNGVLAFMNATLGTLNEHLNAKNEELSRRIKMQQDQAQAQQFTRLAFQIENTTTGYRGIFGTLQNAGGNTLTGATVTVYYMNAVGQPVYQENVQLQGLALSFGQATNWSVLLKNVPGTVRVAARVTNASW